MSLHCPKCGGLVYARSNTNCGHCGADLPAEFQFTEAKLADEQRRINGLQMMPRPQFPIFTIGCWGVCAIGYVILAKVYHHRFYWLMGALWIASVIERLGRYSSAKRKFDLQLRNF